MGHKPTNQTKQTFKLLMFYEMTPSFRGVSERKFAEFLREISRRKRMVCANFREISRSFLRESSRLRIFVRGVNAKKELFSSADLYMHTLSLLCLASLDWDLGKQCKPSV